MVANHVQTVDGNVNADSAKSIISRELILPLPLATIGTLKRGKREIRVTSGLQPEPPAAVGVAWLDDRDDGTGRCYSVYFTASLDGGVKYLPAQRVSNAPSCPDSTQNGGAQGRWPRGGDYFGLAAAADGRFHIFWPDARGKGRFQIWAATVEVSRGQ